MKENVMIDIETMGLQSNAAILSIGAVAFDKEGLGETFYQKINLDSCLRAGLTVDASTIIWWMQQSEEARKEIFNNNHVAWPLKTALSNCFDFIYKNKEVGSFKIWSNGKMDIVVLENAFTKCDLYHPWRYNDVRDFRTYKAMSREVENIPEDRPVAHHALEDAIWQALYTIEVMNERFVETDEKIEKEKCKGCGFKECKCWC